MAKETAKKRRARLKRERAAKLNSDFELHQMAMISALGQIPRTEHGPNWTVASAEQRRLASDLIEYSLPHAEKHAHKMAGILGHVPYHKRSHMIGQVEFGPRGHDDEDAWNSASQIRQRFDPYVGSDADADDHVGIGVDDAAVDDEPSSGKQIDLSDIDHLLLRSIHEAAAKYNSNRKKDWLAYLRMVVRDDVRDFLKREESASGFTEREKGSRDLKFAPQDINDAFATTWAAADATVHERWRLLAHNGDTNGIVLIYLLWWGKCSTSEIAAALGISDKKAQRSVKRLRDAMPALTAGLDLREKIASEVSRFNNYKASNVRLADDVRTYSRGRTKDLGFTPLRYDPGNPLFVQYGPTGPRALGVKAVFLEYLRTPITYLVNAEPVAPVGESSDPEYLRLICRGKPWFPSLSQTAFDHVEEIPENSGIKDKQGKPFRFSHRAKAVASSFRRFTAEEIAAYVPQVPREKLSVPRAYGRSYRRFSEQQVVLKLKRFERYEKYSKDERKRLNAQNFGAPLVDAPTIVPTSLEDVGVLFD